MTDPNTLNLELDWWNIWQQRIREANAEEHPIIKESRCLLACIAQKEHVCYYAQYKRGMK